MAPPLPVSRSRADKLGKLLAAGNGSPDDEADFRAILMAFDEAKEAAQQRLARCGIQTTGRTKTRSTLLDKVRRGTALKSVQDIAGLRTVVDGGLLKQDEVARSIVDEYGSELARVYDRRAQPMHGYRAVHVVVQQDGLNVEVQVRTPLQDAWAQMSEKFDLWGRGIRYGQDPPDPDSPIALGVDGLPSRREVWDHAQDASDAIAIHEQRELEWTSDDPLMDTSPLDEFDTAIRRWIASMINLADTVQRLERS